MFERQKKWFAERWGYATTEAPIRDPKKVGLKKVGQALKGRGAQEFEESPIDLAQVTAAYKTDSYIRKAVNKYADLMFKTGWEINAKDEAVSEYIWLRLKFIAEQTGVPTEHLFKEIAFNLVLYGNAFVAKQRQGNPPQGVKMQGYSSNKPVLGYFVLPAHTIKISRDPSGKILRYEQDTGSGDTLVIKPEDMVHFTYNRDTGRAFGTPYIWNSLDDVKLLRQIEENVARLIYRNLFPLYQYKVGIDKPGFEATEEEIDYIREQIREMPLDGGVVVPERHDITVVSQGTAALDADPYLRYFRQRVFTGLGVSDIVMGIGDTANRGTADNLSAEMIDGVKEFQSIFQTIFQAFIVNELLFEGGYDPVLNPEHEANFVFHEIELDAKIKKENHIIQLFTQNAITHEEMRILIGLDPVADEGRLYFNMVTGALQAQAAQEAVSAANAKGTNKDQPSNQNGTQGSPGAPKRSSRESLDESLQEFSPNPLTEANVRVNLHSELGISSHTESMKRVWRSFREDALTMSSSGRSKEYIKSFAIEIAKQQMNFTMNRYLTDAFTKGILDASGELGARNTGDILARLEVKRITDKSKTYVNRLMDDMERLIFKAMDEQVDMASIINGAFNSNEFRLGFTSSTEMHRAYNYGRAVLAKSHGLEEAMSHVHEGDCVTCKSHSGQPIKLNNPSLLDAVPPHHPNCACIIEFQPNGGGVS